MSDRPRHTTDEDQIRQLVATWLAASQVGDLETVLGLMTDDVVFLVAGRSPMNKSEFAALSRVPPGGSPPIVRSESHIQEIEVSGDLAVIWTALSVAITPAGAATPMMRAGHTLTVFRREDGRWRLARDANLLVAVPRSPD